LERAIFIKSAEKIKEDGSYALLLKLKPRETHQLKTFFTVIFPENRI
jgi:hypothetical protein